MDCLLYSRNPYAASVCNPYHHWEQFFNFILMYNTFILTGVFGLQNTWKIRFSSIFYIFCFFARKPRKKNEDMYATDINRTWKAWENSLSWIWMESSSLTWKLLHCLLKKFPPCSPVTATRFSGKKSKCESRKWTLHEGHVVAF